MLRGATFSALVCVALTVAPEAWAQSNSLTNYLGPQEIAMGEGMRATAIGPLSVTLNPAGLSLSKQLVFQGSYGFRPEDDASIASAVACDSTVVVPGCFYYNYFSSSPEIAGNSMSRRIHQFGVTASRAITENVLFGVNAKYFDLDTDLTGEEDASGFAVDAGIIIRAGSTVNIGAVGYNLIAEDSPEYPRAVAAAVAVRPTDNLVLAFDSRWDVESDDSNMKGARFGGGAEYFFTTSDKQAGFPIRVGALHDRGTDISYVTAGLGYNTLRIGIDVGMRRQVSGGDDEMMFHAGLRLFGPSMATQQQ